MSFNSFEFLLFFIAVLFVFFATPHRFRGLVLLASSYMFYGAWRPAYCLLLLFTTLVDYLSGLVIGGSERVLVRRIALIVSLSINVGILATLKYLDFALTSFSGLAGLLGATMHPTLLGLVLPVGISFYTFQSIAYTIDVYRRQLAVERSFLVYAQYVSFFPQLVAGPIERGGHMLPQFKREHALRAENFAVGLWLIGWGLFQKMCIADLVSSFVTAVYAAPARFGGAYNLIATLFFAIQIYADFCGYSTIARGVARMFDYELMVNFRQPYFSGSITDFWRRWNISLSSWFRDYVYFPLGGNRVGDIGQLRNIFVVFVLSGLWHGAAWTFVFWGALHGAALVVERLARRTISLSPAVLNGRMVFAAGWLWTAAVVLCGWVFFRARTFDNAMAVFGSLRHLGGLSYDVFKTAGFPAYSIVSAVLLMPILFLVDYLTFHHQPVLLALRRRPLLGACAGVLLLYAIIFFGIFGHADFIYFQF